MTKRPKLIFYLALVLGLVIAGPNILQSFVIQVPLYRAYALQVQTQHPAPPETYQAILTTAPDNIFALRKLSAQELQAGNTQSALEHLKHAAQVDPNNILIQYDLLDVLWQTQQYNETDYVWNTIESSDIQANITASAYITRGEFSKAAVWLEHMILDKGEKSSSTIFQYAWTSVQAQQSQRAYQVLKPLLDELKTVNSSDSTDSLQLTPAIYVFSATTESTPSIYVPGGNLWTLYGQTASYATFPSIGAFWTSYLAGIVVDIPTDGQYTISTELQHASSGPIKYGFDIDGTLLKIESLSQEDWAWESSQTTTYLKAGLHVVGLRCLNADPGVKRAGFVKFIEIQKKA